MSIKRDTISELREKLANVVKELKFTKGATQNLKRLKARIAREDGNKPPKRRRSAPETDGLELFGGSTSAENNKNNIQSFSHRSAALEEEVLNRISPYKNSGQKLENEGDLKDLIGH